MDPTPHIVESALLLLFAFFIGCLIGFGLKRLSKPHRASTQGHTKSIPDRPVDDLKKIKGIGPKLESTLHENGIVSFRQIAAWDARTIAEMNVRLSFNGRIEREKWVSQAQMLAKTQQH